MVPLKFRLRSFHRQSIFTFLSLIVIITIVVCDILPIPNSISIALKLFLFTIIILWFELWFSTWGKVWILSTTLLLVCSQINPIFPSGPLLLVHILFLLVMMFLFDRKETQERVLHQRNLNRMHALLRQNPPLIQTVDYTGEALILLDNTGLIIELNSQSTFLLSLQESCLVGKPIFDVLGILPNFQPTNVPENGEFTWETHKEITKYIKFRTRPLLDDAIPSGTLLTLFDISEAKKRSEMSLQIEKLSIISQVSAGLAHEIRNPLTTIKGFMQLITPEQWPESFRPYQQLILHEIQTVDQLLENFILLTSPSAPQMSRFNLAETISSMTQTIQPMIHMQNISFILELSSPAVYIMGDPEQLLQALLSLLNNAVEASPKGGKVIIRLTEYESHARISVVDEGPGIPKNQRDRVLDPFFTTQANRTGLGLTIAQQIILSHHGMLHFCESLPPGGTEAIIDLPYSAKFTSSLSA